MKFKRDIDDIELVESEFKLKAHKGWIEYSQRLIAETSRKLEKYSKDGNRNEEHKAYLMKKLEEGKKSLQRNKEYYKKEEKRLIRLDVRSSTKTDKVTKGLRKRRREDSSDSEEDVNNRWIECRSLDSKWASSDNFTSISQVYNNGTMPNRRKTYEERRKIDRHEWNDKSW
ncbi:Oidioi.mRNA.OKI2018_I69.XSR.g13642.t1.cds [Oikopleura dioica]|uniref:Oidioi.mRNA.OKI2018_I69.XSR.g13642.t1.cds n=1 Tax=Oikopleura dioica TaxID=34765 RepID=A0ABN7SBC5_OIKDI|nr:Oidioi.mRNA.OKI2018_I69.XSR.g13642.t1.cds [Oikopleura dioica]